ncbi:MAG: SocA family protein [Nitrospirae bacterium]|nr:SocA family protein [Nitrospirota bacterium]MBF0618097.1 SocA family protein [Nitrospirota bacterium]
MATEKLKDLIAAVLSKAGKVSKVKLTKLILFTEIEHYKKTGKSITGLYFLRLPYGPVIAFFDEMLEEGLDILWSKETSLVPIYEYGGKRKQYSYYSFNEPSLSLELNETITSVVNTYGKMTGTELSNMSHKLPAWRYSEPNEPVYVSELAIDTDEKYFAMLDIVEELDDTEDDLLEEEILRILSKA